MANSVISSRLRRKDKEYLLQTSWLEAKQVIVNSLFCQGNLVSQNTLEYGKGVNPEKISELLRLVHGTELEEIRRLFELSDNPNGQQNEAEMRFLLGEAFYHRLLFEEAVFELTKSLDLNPNNPPALELSARIHLSSGNFSLAKDHLRQAVELFPKYADLRLLYGQALAALDEFVSALDQLKQAAEINPYYAQAYFESGIVLLQNVLKKKDYDLTLGLPASALQYFNRAVQLDPALLIPSYQEGLDFLHNSEYREALARLLACRERQREKHRNSLHDYYLKFICSHGLVDEKTLSRHIKALQKMLEDNPTYADLHFQLGTIYMLLCRYITQKATGQYRLALRQNPRYKKAERNLKLCENHLKGMDLLLKAML